MLWPLWGSMVTMSSVDELLFTDGCHCTQDQALNHDHLCSSRTHTPSPPHVTANRAGGRPMNSLWLQTKLGRGEDHPESRKKDQATLLTTICRPRDQYFRGNLRFYAITSVKYNRAKIIIMRRPSRRESCWLIKVITLTLALRLVIWLILRKHKSSILFWFSDFMMSLFVGLICDKMSRIYIAKAGCFMAGLRSVD